ncbi:MAG: sugar ABC transporter substrate-binding protein [Anaerolineales bacterium]|nr:sugar ABC transporter substrate-binding protein [Anaerolineales bacterium]
MKLQKLILFLVVSGIVLAMTACGAAEPETKTLTFSPLALSIPALKGLSEGVKAVGGEMGYDVIVVDPDFDPTKQAQQLNELITTGRTSAAWVISVNPGAMKDVVDQAQAKEVVLVLNGVPEDYGYNGMQAGVTFARINYEKFGGTVGELLGQCVNEKLGGSAKVIFLQSAEGTAGKQEIEESMQGKLAELAPGAEIVATAIISERAEGQNTVSQILQANPDANAVMTTNDEGGLGALGAFKAAGTELPCLVDAGGNDEVLAAVESGEMYGAAALDFQGDMMQTFEAVATMLADPSAPGAQLEVPVIPHKTGE